MDTKRKRGFYFEERANCKYLTLFIKVGVIKLCTTILITIYDSLDKFD